MTGAGNPWFGKHPSEESREKMRQAQLGKKHTEETRKKIGDGHRGLKRNAETKKRMSESAKGKHNGDKHGNWQGGKSLEPYAVDWNETLRRSIRERDKYTCQMCKSPQGDIALHVHHIDDNKENSHPSNLISLCRSCHGKTGHDKKKWEEYFKNNA